MLPRAAPLAIVLALGCAPVQTPPMMPGGAFTSPTGGYAAVHVPDVPAPEPGQGQPVSLDGILAYADQHAPALRVARARLRLGDAAVAGASPLLPANPTLSVNVGPGINPGGDHVDLAGSLSQRLEIAGERGLRLDAATRTRERLQAELDQARWEVHRDAHAAFHQALVQRERLATADRLVAFQQRLLEITQGSLRAGDVSPLTVRLAEGELSQARVARIAAAQRYRRSRLRLAAGSGWPAAHPPEPAGVLDEPRPPPGAATLVDAARRHQPRLRTLQAARNEAQARATAADRDAWPEPTVGVQVNRESFPAGPPEVQLLGTVSLPLPIFQRNQGARANAQAEVWIADAERTAFESQLENRIEEHRTAVVAAAAQVQTYGGEILPAFEENLRLLQRAFELGEIDLLQVSVARERFLRTQTAALDAYIHYFRAVADLEGAIGTDLWSEEREAHRRDPDQGARP